MNFKLSNDKIYKLRQMLLPALAVIITISIIRFPEEAFESAVKGIDVWLNIVLPALLPFFIGAQLLMGLGVVHFMGVLLEPFMRPLFNVPGSGSFVMAMGLASGYPVGAMLTGKIVKKGLCNTIEAERLISFTNTADPLFMVGAVAVGMFKDVRLGTIIAISHYISSLILGLIMRYHAKKYDATTPVSSRKRESLIIKAARELLRARRQDNRSFGQLIGDCIKDSINSMFIILGFIILFSVIIKIINATGFINAIHPVINMFLNIFGLDESLSPAIVSGFFEITLGTQIASQSPAPLIQKVILASSIIAWSGLSVHFQVMSMVSDTKIRLMPYIYARILHAFLAGATTYVLMMLPINSFNSVALPAFGLSPQPTSQSWMSMFKASSKVFIILFLFMLFISVLIHVLRGLEVIGFKVVKK
ncbi:MAG: sporulation integral membrane protein YlbJ [Tepidanaerobacteraceae bacterium]|jgi:sporulation integral membrane protein YlbJ